MTDTTPPDDAAGPSPDPAPPADSIDGAQDGAYGAAYGGETAPVEQPARGGRRGLVIGGIAAVLAVVAGAAVYATTALSGGGMQPDELAPKATFAYLKVDLDPAASQKLAARSFFGKFPKIKSSGDGGNVFDDALESIFSDDQLDYNRDVKPWFDKRAAIAAFPSSGGTEVVGILRSKDDAKAKASLDKAATQAKNDGDDPPVYKIVKGYVVVSDKQAAVDDAIRLSDEASLHDNAVYRDDVDALHGDQIATGWVDLQPAYQAGKEFVPYAPFLGTTVTDQIKGRIVAGIHLSGDYAELEGLAVEVPQQGAAKPSDPTLLKNLPASTVAALSVNGFGAALQKQLASLGGGAGAFDPRQLVNSFLGQTGMTLEGDVLPLFGEQTVFSLGRVFEDFDTLRAGIVSKVADATKAATSVPKLNQLAQGLPVELKSTLKGDTLYVATPGDYATELQAGNGGLGSAPKFTKAMGDVSAVSSAGYVDLQAFLADSTDPQLKPLRAVGFVSGTRGANQFFRLRLVVG